MGLKKYIPDAITSLNLLCGVLGVILTLKGRPDSGFLLMLCAAAADFCDGFAARLLKAGSDFGRELDSLADDVSFGVLPAVMLCEISGTEVLFLKYFPAVLAVFSGLRLAKFNLDDRQHGGFLGLPTPASAMICGSLACFVCRSPGSFLAGWCASPVFIPLLAVLLCALLVSEVPMFAMKFGTGARTSRLDRVKRIVFLAVVLAAVAVVLALHLHWSVAVLVSFTGYVLVNLLTCKCAA